MPNVERVDLKFRCGIVLRDADPKQWRWKEWPEGPHDADIEIWQPAGLLKEWKGKQNGPTS